MVSCMVKHEGLPAKEAQSLRRRECTTVARKELDEAEVAPCCVLGGLLW